MKRLPTQDRYMRDVQFKSLVDMMYIMICDMNMTPTEVREAAMLATMKFEQDHIRPMILRDGSVEYGKFNKGTDYEW